MQIPEDVQGDDKKKINNCINSFKMIPNSLKGVKHFLSDFKSSLDVQRNFALFVGYLDQILEILQAIHKTFCLPCRNSGQSWKSLMRTV